LASTLHGSGRIVWPNGASSTTQIPLLKNNERGWSLDLRYGSAVHRRGVFVANIQSKRRSNLHGLEGNGLRNALGRFRYQTAASKRLRCLPTESRETGLKGTCGSGEPVGGPLAVVTLRFDFYKTVTHQKNLEYIFPAAKGDCQRDCISSTTRGRRSRVRELGGGKLQA